MNDPLSPEAPGHYVLIGQYDSPFVRRVGIAMQLYGIEYEHRPWSVMRDAELIARFNPLRRVPTLVCPGGEVLVESSLILDALDALVDDDTVMLPRRGAVRVRGLQICGLAMGFADKVVSMVYEGLFSDGNPPRSRWVARCAAQLGDTASRLDATRASAPGDWVLGDRISHADIALAVAWRIAEDGVPDVCERFDAPALLEHSRRCEAMDVFRRISLPLTFPT